MPRNFVCLINPISGTRSKTAAIKIIEKKLALAGYKLQVIHTNKEGNYDFLQTKIYSESITDIIVCGGDGSVNQVASALLGIDISFGIIPMGSGNGLARTAGISSKVASAMDIILEGKSQHIDAFYINNRFSCMLAGLGMDAQVAHDFAKQSSRGLFTYIKETIRNFFSARAFPFTISMEHSSFQTHAFFISIANSNQFGNNVTIAPQASLSDGLLDIVIVNKMNKMRLIYKLLRQLRFGKPISFQNAEERKAEIIYFQSNHFYIKNSGHAALHIDGEPVDTAADFEVKVIEKAFRLLMPE